MAVAGVIAEYNPFHRGHAWQLEELRRRLGENTAVVACMSGSFVQRGDFAIALKHARAEMALLGGVDLVLELPAPWSAAGAERFAQGAAAVLEATGVVTHLAFGCECGTLEPLRSAADCLDGPSYPDALRRVLAGGGSFAAARQTAVRELAGAAADCLSRPNDILAVEYLRALKKQGSAIEPLALPRVGAAHDSGELGDFSSASAIRERVLAGESWRELVPEGTAHVLEREMGAGRAPVSAASCERAILARLRQMGKEDFRPYDGGNEGLYRRFYQAVQSETALEDVLAAAKTKRYPLARLRRMLVLSALGVRTPGPGEMPPYLRVLGANGRGRGLLREMVERAVLPVLTKPGSVRRLGERAQEVFDLESRCTDFYVLAFPELAQAGPGQEFAIGPVMR